MIADLVIRGATLVTPDGTIRAALAVQNGRIAAIGNDDAMPQAARVFDAAGLHLLPGLIDTHVHLRAPGNPEREDVASGSASAAAGGVTTILEMPISVPACSTPEVFRRRCEVFRDSLVHYGFYAGASGDNLDQIQSLADAGVIAYKTFRTGPVPGREHEFWGICCPDAGQMLETMRRVKETGLLHVVHAEEVQILDLVQRQIKQAGRTDYKVHPDSRPLIAETTSVGQMLAMARETGVRFQVAHASAPAVVDLVTRAREDGVNATVETCPPYLFFTEEAFREHGPYAKINPPMRTAEDVEGMWERLRRGEIDVIGTDHSPFLVSEKEPFWGNIWGAYPGAPGLEAFLPLMLTAVNQGKLSLRQMVKVTAENAARLFGLYPRKGRIAVGADADLVLVDMERTYGMAPLTWHTKSRETGRIFAGFPCQGAPVATIVMGQVVVQENRIIEGPAAGRLLSPTR